MLSWKGLLREGSRDNALLPYLDIVKKKHPEATLSQLKQALLNKFVSEAGMHSLSLGSNFYLAGVARYYFNGDLTSGKYLNLLVPRVKDHFIPDVCDILDKIIVYLRDAYIDSVGTKWEQPEDFGTLQLSQLIKKYGKKAVPKEKKQEEKNIPQIDTSNTAGKNYTYEILYSYEDAKKYKQYTEPGAWCITYGSQHYNAYVRRLGIHYVIFRRNGFENVERVKGPNWTPQKPQDEYGNSLIAVLQSNSNGEPVYITSRWNHGASVDSSRCEADHAYTKEEFLRVIGDDGSCLQRAFEQWQANKPKKNSSNVKANNLRNKLALRACKYAQMLLDNGQQPQSVLKTCLPFCHLNGKEIGYYDDYKKIKFKKIVSIVTIPMDGAFAVTLSVGGKLLFDTICFNLEDPTWFNCRSPFSLLPGEDGIIQYSKREFANAFYSLKKRCFVEVDGRRFFARGFHVNDNNYTRLSLNNTQIALFNRVTGKPLKLPNGDVWAERITRGKTKNYIDNCEGLLELIYDSASGEKYFFNTNTHQFVNIEGVGTEIGDMSIDTSNNEYTVLEADLLSKHKVCKVLIDNNSGEIKEFFGEKYFSRIAFFEFFNLLLLHTLDYKKSYLIDLTNGKPIDIPETIDMISTAFVDGKSMALVTWTDKNYNRKRWGGDLRSVFNPETRQFLINPFRNDIYFPIYGSGSPNGESATFYGPDTKKRYITTKGY